MNKKKLHKIWMEDIKDMATIRGLSVNSVKVCGLYDSRDKGCLAGCVGDDGDIVRRPCIFIGKEKHMVISTRVPSCRKAVTKVEESLKDVEDALNLQNSDW